MAELKQLTKYVLQQENLELIEQWMGIQPVVEHMIPSGKRLRIWKITILNGKTHYKWQCSIAIYVCLPEGKT